MKLSKLFYALPAAMLVFTACSSEEEGLQGGATGNDDARQIITVAVSNQNQTTRAGRVLDSSAPGQNIDKVKLILVETTEGENKNKIQWTETIEDWQNKSENYGPSYSASNATLTTGSGKQTDFEIPKETKDGKAGYRMVQGHTYVVYAVGYTSEGSQYTYTNIDAMTTGQTFDAAKFAVTLTEAAKDKRGEEIFAGSAEVGENFKTTVILNRQVAGTYVYLKDIPYILDATKSTKPGSKLQVVVAQANDALHFGQFVTDKNHGHNLSAGVGTVINGYAQSTAAEDAVLYEINLKDWFTNIVEDEKGLIKVGEEGNYNWKTEGHNNYAVGSVFAGDFLIPVAAVEGKNTLKLVMLDEDDQPLREWKIQLPTNAYQKETAHNLLTYSTNGSYDTTNNHQDDINTYNILRNYLYGVGTRLTSEPSNPGTEEGDKPEPLNNKQELKVQVNSNWEVIYNMGLD